jgi:glycylpeptide N-tetradecanoyltransferase
VLARGTGHDVFNALDIADNDQDEVLRALKFAPGDGRLRYYLYNWRMGGREELAAKEIGLVLL